MDNYNAGNEIGTDGYESAYQELKGGTTAEVEAGNSYTGKCTEGEATKSAQTMHDESDEAGGFDSAEAATLAWLTSGETNAEITALATGTGTEALSICALLCSA